MRRALLLCLAAPFLFGGQQTLLAQTVTFNVTVEGPNSGNVDLRDLGLCSGGGSSGPVVCQRIAPAGSARVVTANAPGLGVPGVISAFSGSVPAECSLKTTCAFTITEDSALTMTFDGGTYGALFRPVSIVLPAGTDGEVDADNNRCQNFDPRQGGSCVTSYAAGSQVTLEADPPAGHLFLGFSSGIADAAPCGVSPCTFVLNDASSVTASFARLHAIDVAPSSATVDVGGMQGFTATGTFLDGATAMAAPMHGDMGTWRFRADMPTGRLGLAAAALNGRLYALGGVSAAGPGSSGPMATVEVYDPATDSWSPAPDMGTPRESLAAVAAGGALIAIGGNTTGGAPVASVEWFDPIAGWSGRAPMSLARSSLAAAAVDGKVYAIGGRDAAGNVLNLLEEYDPATNTWITKAPMPTPRRAAGAGVVNGLLYVVGGQGADGSILSTVEAYDPAVDAWTNVAPMPGSRETHGVGVIGGQLYAVGGNFGGFLSTVVAYDAAGNTWWNKAFMPAEGNDAASAARGELAAAVIDGVLYVAGGQRAGMGGGPPEASRFVQAFTDHLVWDSHAPSVADVSQHGQARALAVGIATISARTGATTCAATASCGVLSVELPRNVPPAVTIFGIGTQMLQEGGTLNRGGSFRDPDAQTWSATVDYGDGGGPEPLVLTIAPPGGGGPTGSFTLSHRYADNGSYTVTVIVTDTEGGTGSAALQVTVTNVAPSVFGPMSASTEVGRNGPFACASFHDRGIDDSPWTATVDYGDGGGPEPVPPAGIRIPGSCGGPSGPIGAFDLAHAYASPGTYTVTVSVSDKDGGTGFRSFPVEVSGDTAPPTIVAVSADPAVLWPPNHRMVQVTVDVVVRDDVDPSPACRIDGVRSSEPGEGLGGADTPPDWSVVAPLTVNLRAEREGAGRGRLYTISLECRDAAGNVARATTSVAAPHDMGRR